MNIEKLLANSQLTLTQEFEITRLTNMDLNTVTKQQLLDTLIGTASLLLLKENMIKELIKLNV